MIKEAINLKGHIRIWSEDAQGKRELLVDKKNAIQTNAYAIVAKALVGDLLSPLDQIQVYDGGVLLANPDSVRSSSSTNAATIFARFGTTSFTGHFDELKLNSTGDGIFSRVTGLNVTKPVNRIIEIEWIITIDSL